MNDSPPSNAHDRPKPARAADAAPPAEASPTGETLPTPARALFEDDAPAAATPVQEATLEDGDDRWTVRVCGRSRSGSSSGSVSLLLLAFHRGDAQEPELETLVVAEALEDLGEEALSAALGRGRTPPEPGSRKEIFPEVGGRSRGRDG